MELLLQMSFMGGIIILIVALLRKMLQNRLHRTVFLLLWAVAALRLTVPILLPSTASVYNLTPYIGTSQEMPVQNTQRELPAAVPFVPLRESIAVPVSPHEQAPVIVEPKAEVSFVDLLPFFWAVGFCGCLLYFVWIHVRARLQYRFALPEKAPAYLGKVRLRRLDTISAPLVYGFFRPVILLPTTFPKKESREYEQVLHHELTHIHLGDLWIKAGMLLITCLHWFNPLVWLMLHLLSQDLEMRCDASVIRKLGSKKVYAMALVQAEERRSHHFAEAAFTFSLTELRLKAIARAKVRIPRSIVLCAVLGAILVGCFATVPKAEATEEVQKDAFGPMPTVTVPTIVYTETQEEEVPTSKESLPSAYINPMSFYNGKAEIASLQTAGYEEFGTVRELSLQCGTMQTLTLCMPGNTEASLSAGDGKLIAFSEQYSSENSLYHLSVRGLDAGSAELSLSVNGTCWVKLQVQVLPEPEKTVYYDSDDEYGPFTIAFNPPESNNNYNSYSNSNSNKNSNSNSNSNSSIYWGVPYQYPIFVRSVSAGIPGTSNPYGPQSCLTDPWAYNPNPMYDPFRPSSNYGYGYNYGYPSYGYGYNNGYTSYGYGYNNGYSSYGYGYNYGYPSYGYGSSSNGIYPWG